MGDGRRGGRVLRFAVTGALLVTPLVGCGEDESPEGTETCVAKSRRGTDARK